MAKIKKNHWYSVTGQSLAIYARNAGFDLAVYDEYSDEIQKELRKLAIKEALYAINEECINKEGIDLRNIKRGVYVISLSYPLSVKYEFGRSQVIYIGMGNIMTRFKTHFDRSLFEFMQSLSGASFDFYFANPALKNSSLYYKHIEYLMLEYFSNICGGLNKSRRFPILNKNSGSKKNFKGGTDWWKKPIKASGKRPLWEISPTKYSDFATLD